MTNTLHGITKTELDSGTNVAHVVTKAQIVTATNAFHPILVLQLTNLSKAIQTNAYAPLYIRNPGGPRWRLVVTNGMVSALTNQ